MRVAALYDVHAMPVPLAAVLEALEPEAPDLILFGGDLISGPFPREAVELARSIGARLIRGNREREPSDWDRSALAESVLAELAALPLTVTLDDVLSCRATPDADTPLTTAETPVEVQGEVAAFWAMVVDGEPELRHTAFDVERAAAEIAASGWPGAQAFVTENLRSAPTREEAIAVFERQREA